MEQLDHVFGALHEGIENLVAHQDCAGRAVWVSAPG
jgi:hypothetical protein